MPEYQVEACFQCPLCKRSSRSVVALPESVVDFGSDDSRRYIDAAIALECSECKREMDGHIQIVSGHCNIELVKFRDVLVDSGEPSLFLEYDDPWEYLDIPHDPYEEFEYSMRSIKSMMENYAENEIISTINRMLFVQIISSMEAYLGDTVFNEISNNKDYMKSIVAKNKTLKGVKISLFDAIDGEDHVKKAVFGYLKGILYHNVSLVREIYRSSMGIDIYADIKYIENINKYVSIRHDCVHRNGKNKNGEMISIIDARYLYNVFRDVVGFIDSIEGMIRPSFPKDSIDLPF